MKYGIFQIRTFNRPLHNQYKKTHGVAAAKWRAADCDFHLVGHHGEPDKIFKNSTVPDFRHDLKNKTKGKFPLVVRWIFDNFNCEYDAIGLLDDDGHFIDPVEAVGQHRRCFSRRKKAGFLGPIHGVRLWSHHGSPKDKNFIAKLHCPPWTTFGFQAYRCEAMSQIPYYKFLSKVQFRLDYYLAAHLHNAGWDCYELRQRFDHTCSNGIRSKNGVDLEHALYRLEQTEDDHYAFLEDFDETTKRAKWMLPQLDKIKNGELRKWKKLIREGAV